MAKRMNQLGRVTEDLAEDRAPDVRLTVAVPLQWLQQGSSIEVTIPRLVSCEACGGGGCDACDRRGALVTRERHAAEETTVIHLPIESAPGTSVRLVQQGALPANDVQARGCLLVVFDEGDPSGSVRQISVPGASGKGSPLSWMPWIALLVVIALMFFVFARV